MQPEDLKASTAATAASPTSGFQFGAKAPAFQSVAKDAVATPPTSGFQFGAKAPAFQSVAKDSVATPPTSGFQFQFKPNVPVAAKQEPNTLFYFNHVMQKTITRTVASTFDALGQRQIALPPLAPMVLCMVNTSIFAYIEVHSALCIPKLTTPNWWRSVVFNANADIDVVKFAPRLRSVLIKATADADLHCLMSSLCCVRTLQWLTTPVIWPSDVVLQFQGLKYLDVSCSKITNEELQRLTLLPALDTLRVVECFNLSDLRPIAKCVSLTELDARHLPNLTSNSLTGLETLPLLRTFYLGVLGGVAAPKMRLGEFGAARSLQKLSTNVDLEPNGLEGLETCQTLREVTLERGVQHQLSLAPLQQLSLESIHIGPCENLSLVDVLESLCEPIPSLTFISVRSLQHFTCTSDKLARALNRATSLKKLRLVLMNHDGELFGTLSSELKLEDVFIHCDSLTSVQGIEALPKLTHFSLESSSFGDDKCRPLAEAPVLASLTLRNTQLRTAAALSHLRAVTYLELNKAPDLQDEALVTIASIPTLTGLTLVFCPRVTSFTPVLRSAAIQSVHLDLMPILSDLCTPGPMLNTLVVRRCPLLIVDRSSPLIGAAGTLRRLTIIGVFLFDLAYLKAAMPQTLVSNAIDTKTTPHHLW